MLSFSVMVFTPWFLYSFGNIYKLYFFTSLQQVQNMKTLGDSKLSSKFQVTIPRTVREFLKVEAGNLILFIKDDGNVLIKKGEVRIKD